MISNYGYEDASGYYYITIDGDLCSRCKDRACLSACPQGVYVLAPDDYDDLVAMVADEARNRLRELCSGCKGQNGGEPGERWLPCTAACQAGAIRHSW